MRYIAFDIESTDGLFNEGNLCEFGYCLTDEHFNIIEKDDILIRPVIRAVRPNYGVKLAYSLSQYNNAPHFKESYARIYSLLTQADTLVIGHAIHNDILCINAACMINSLPCPDFNFIDSQLIYGVYMQDKQTSSLAKIATQLNIEFIEHRADEDAYTSLMTIKKICETLGKNLEDVINDFSVMIGKNEHGNVSNCSTPYFVSNAPSIESNNSKRRLISYFLKNVQAQERVIDTNNEFNRKRVAMSNKAEYRDVTLTRRMIQRLYNLGGKYTPTAASADIYVYSDDLPENRSEKCIYLSVDEFLKKLGDLPEIEFDDEAILKAYQQDKKIEKIKAQNELIMKRQRERIR